MSRICLVTPSHIASNPRLVKEADALQSAGHDVHVVAHRYFPSLDAQDAAIYSVASWEYTVVDSTCGFSHRWAKLRYRFARFTLSRGFRLTPKRAARAYHAVIPALAETASHVPADLYIGHCLAGLVAASLAATRKGSQLGFDAEDFHPTETDFAENDPLENSIINLLEKTALPHCTHLTASSPLIAQAYADSYGIRIPTSILNVFPRSEAPPLPVTRPIPTSDNPARIYWFSQTIGAGRGLEEIMPVLAALHTPVELHLRGFISSDYKSLIERTAINAGLKRPIVFHGYAPMSAMVRLAADYDLALSIEPSSPSNRELCLANKIFTYLLAGVPQLLSSTRGHRALAEDLGIAVRFFDPAHPQKTAAALDAWWSDPAAVTAARAHAWHLGQTRYNWDYEKTALVGAINRALS